MALDVKGTRKRTVTTLKRLGYRLSWCSAKSPWYSLRRSATRRGLRASHRRAPYGTGGPSPTVGKKVAVVHLRNKVAKPR